MIVKPDAVAIDYPESDGKPMGETDLHRDWMVRIIELLRHRFRGQQVYVSGDLLVYYEEGVVNKVVVPDAFIVKDSDPRRRRVYKIWEEGKVPDVVFEVTSLSTKREDMVFKLQKYDRMGVGELFLFDPTSDYLTPPLQGFHTGSDGFEPITPDGAGRLQSQQLDAALMLEDDHELVFYDARSGEQWLTGEEAEEAARKSEAAARIAEAAARHAAEATAAKLAAEVERLKRQLKQGHKDH